MTNLTFDKAVQLIEEFTARVWLAEASLTPATLKEFDDSFTTIYMSYIDASILLTDIATRDKGENAYEVFKAMSVLDEKTRALHAIGEKRKEFQAGE